MEKVGRLYLALMTKPEKSNLQRSAVKDVTKNVLLSWGILEKDENEKVYPTNAYVYLTGQGGMRSMIQCAVFKGTTRSVFLDRRNYEGPLWEQVDEAVQFVLRNIRMGSRVEGVYRQDIYELPPDSVSKMPDMTAELPDTTVELPDNEQEQQIYKYVLKNGSITTAETAELLGVKHRRARAVLMNMVEDAYLRKEGAARSTIYVKQ